MTVVTGSEVIVGVFEYGVAVLIVADGILQFKLIAVFCNRCS